MGHQIKRLKPKHLRILELLLIGKSQKEIALELSLSEYGISLIVNSPVFQNELARRRAEQNEKADLAETTRRLTAREILDKSANEAANVQIRLLGSANEAIKQRSAMDILDRTGYPKVTKTENQSKSIFLNLTQKDLDRIQKASLTCFGEEIPIEFEDDGI